MIYRQKASANFTIISNDFLNDIQLSWKAKGMISYLMSLPDDWVINIQDLTNRSKDGRDGTANTLREIIEVGYGYRKQNRNAGKFDKYDYMISDSLLEKPEPEKPEPEKPEPEKPEPEKPDLINTNKPNTNLTNKKFSKENQKVPKFVRTKPSKKINPIYQNFSFFKDDFQQLWLDEFLPLKRRKKASTTDRALLSQLNKILEYSNNNYLVALSILTKSVDSGWTDFYEPKGNNQPNRDNLAGTRRYTKNRIIYPEGIEIKT